MASWIRGTQASVDAGVFDGEQIETPRVPPEMEFDPDGPLSDQEAIHLVWLDYVRRGASPDAIAKYFKISRTRVFDGLKQARLHEKSRPSIIADPDVAVLFPVNPYTPISRCAHPERIPAGKAEYCPICHQTGIEGHPALRDNPSERGSRHQGNKRYAPDDGLMGGKGDLRAVAS